MSSMINALLQLQERHGGGFDPVSRDTIIVKLTNKWPTVDEVLPYYLQLKLIVGLLKCL